MGGSVEGGGGERRNGVWRGEGRGRLYLTLYCLHRNDFCIKVGSDEIENHYNVS